ncbi:MAG: thiol:disulfide interchange protein DsbD [Candidatus Poribacteria bacterium]|nr:MAG: thiol:disulfide interchange protein DsbD [Candidatus Poribacteria bacterium]
MKKQALFALWTVLIGWCSGPAVGQGISSALLGGTVPVQFSAEVAPEPSRAGETVEVRVHARIEPGWHIYSLTLAPEIGPQPTRITVEAEHLEGPGFFEQPEPLRKYDAAFDATVESFEGSVSFVGRFRVREGTPPGTYPVQVAVRYMVCNAKTCLPPTTQTVALTHRVEEGPARAEFLQPLPTSKPPQGVSASPAGVEATSSATEAAYRVERARDQGLWAYLLFAASMGFLALLTPCVFPMIPITVSFFTKQQASTRLQSVRRALLYCLGIVTTFTGLGIVLALLFGAAAIQNLAANVWVNLLIAAIFVAFALNLFGAYEIRVPSRLLNFVGGKGQGGGTVAILLMGLTFSLTSFTCTVPFVGTVLVAATQGEVFWAVAGMLAFSAAFASPFFFLALFPQLLATLPRSGGWLNSVKVTMGFLELAAALKFISNIDLVMGWGALPRELFLAAWVAIALVAGFYLLGKIQLPLDSPVERLSVPRLLLSLFFFAVGFYLLTGLFGKPLGELDAFLPPYSTGGGSVLAGGGSSSSGEGLSWIEDYDRALVEAQATGRPIFVDFTGVTCTNCRWMEKNIFTRPEIADRLGRFVRVRLWTDLADERSRRYQRMQQERFGTVALPFYAILSPEGDILATFDGLTRDPEEFARFLDEGYRRFENALAMR